MLHLDWRSPFQPKARELKYRSLGYRSLFLGALTIALSLHAQAPSVAPAAGPASFLNLLPQAQAPAATTTQTPSAISDQNQGQSQNSSNSSNPSNSSAGSQNGDSSSSDNNRSDSNGRNGSNRSDQMGRTQQSASLPPEPATAFQQLVANTTGTSLPLFGHDLFSRAPSTFAPVNDVPVTADYMIGPGDEIQIQIWGAVNLRGNYTVTRTGDITLPDVGTVHIAGVRYSDLQSYLHNQFQRVIRNFQLSANLGQLRSIQIFLVGNVRQPGAYTVSSLSTLLNALFASGGPSASGTLRHIQLKRGSSSEREFDLYDLLLHGDKSQDARLEPGDVIYVPEVGPQVAIVGGVIRPAIYELRNEGTAEEIINMAGGLSVTASDQGIRLERIVNRTQRSVVDLALKTEGRNLKVQDGDILSISSLVDRFANAVTLRGNVASPGRYAWHPGMRVSDLIPNQMALLTRDYWSRHNQQALITSGRIGSEGAVPVTGNSQSNSKANPSALAQTTEDHGAFTARNEVALDAAEVDWNYAVVERMNPDLTTTLLPFNLGRIVLDGDHSNDPELQAGDIVTIFSNADLAVPSLQRTRFVRLEGEIAAAGVYSVHPGETLRQLVARAGGVTNEAYLYGSQFTRVSTQRLQQSRLNEYLDQLEAQMASPRISGNSATDASRAAAQNVINRLRGTTASGRIVLEFTPHSKGTEAIPDMQLEDGDRLIIPRRPDSVSVAGNVYNQNDFLFTPKRDTDFYLKKAGGPMRDADTKREFIIRADGSILSRQYTDSLFRHGFDSHEIFPGDTIVVPQSIRNSTLIKNLVDITQIISQFGIGVAAVRVLQQ